MLSEKFIDEMWSKCYWTRDYLNGTSIPVGPPLPGEVTMNSDQLRDLLVENRELRTRNANLEMDMASHTEIVEMWNDKCDEVKQLQRVKEMMKQESTFQRSSIQYLEARLAELKQKLLELGGCPNANN